MSTTIVVGKGGVGKSTLAMHLARKLSSEGLVAVDLDISNESFSRAIEKGSVSNTLLMKLAERSSFKEKGNVIEVPATLRGDEIFRRACIEARKRGYEHILIDAPGGIAKDEHVKEILAEVNNIIFIMSASMSVMDAIENNLRYLKEKRLLGKTIVIYNSWPITREGGIRKSLSEDVKEGLKVALQIEERHLRDRYGNLLVRDISVIRRSEHVKKDGALPEDIRRSVSDLYEKIKRGYVPNYAATAPRGVGRKASLLAASLAAMFALLPTTLNIEKGPSPLDEYGEALIEEIEEDDANYVTAFIDRRGFAKRAEPGESIEGIAFWAFQRFSGFFTLDEEGARKSWDKYRREFYAVNSYKKSIMLGESVKVPPYSGDRHEDYFLRLLMLEVIDDIMDNAKIVSPFMEPRSYGGVEGGHPGIDLESPLGTPIRAFRAGKVVRRGFSSSYGYFLEIEDLNDPRVRYFYAHMAKRGRPRTHSIVKRGERIGYMGNSGRSKGPHLHFEVRVRAENTWIKTDPLQEVEREAKHSVDKLVEMRRSKY